MAHSRDHDVLRHAGQKPSQGWRSGSHQSSPGSTVHPLAHSLAPPAIPPPRQSQGQGPPGKGGGWSLASLGGLVLLKMLAGWKLLHLADAADADSAGNWHFGGRPPDSLGELPHLQSVFRHFVLFGIWDTNDRLGELGHGEPICRYRPVGGLRRLGALSITIHTCLARQFVTPGLHEELWQDLLSPHPLPPDCEKKPRSNRLPLRVACTWRRQHPAGPRVEWIRIRRCLRADLGSRS